MANMTGLGFCLNNNRAESDAGRNVITRQLTLAIIISFTQMISMAAGTFGFLIGWNDIGISPAGKTRHLGSRNLHFVEVSIFGEIGPLNVTFLLGTCGKFHSFLVCSQPHWRNTKNAPLWLSLHTLTAGSKAVQGKGSTWEPMSEAGYWRLRI